MPYCATEQLSPAKGFPAYNLLNNVMDNNMISLTNIEGSTLQREISEDHVRNVYYEEKNNEFRKMRSNIERQDSCLSQERNTCLSTDNKLLNHADDCNKTHFNEIFNKLYNLEDQNAVKNDDKKIELAENMYKRNNKINFAVKQNINYSLNVMNAATENSLMDGSKSEYNKNMDIAAITSIHRNEPNNSLYDNNNEVITNYSLNDFKKGMKTGMKREIVSPYQEENMPNNLPNLEKIDDLCHDNPDSPKYNGIQNRQWYEDDGAIRTERVLLRPWLESLIEQGGVPGLEWLNREEKIFKVPWKHRSKKTWSLKHCCVFLEWAHNTGRWMPGDPEPNYAQLKTRLRCAFSKAPDIEEMKNLHCSKTEEPYKVYRFIPKKDSKSHIACRRIRKFTPIMRKNACSNRPVFNRKLKKPEDIKNSEKIIIKREISPGLMNEIIVGPCSKMSKLTTQMANSKLKNDSNSWYSKNPINSFVKTSTNLGQNNYKDDNTCQNKGPFTGSTAKWGSFNDQQVQLQNQQPHHQQSNKDENIFKVASYYCNMNQQQSTTRFSNDADESQKKYIGKIKSPKDLQIPPLTITYDSSSNVDMCINKILPAAEHKLPPILHHSQLEEDLSSDDESYILPSVRSGSDYLKLKNTDDQLIPLIVVDGSGRKKCRPTLISSDSEVQEEKSGKRINLLPTLKGPYMNNVASENWYNDKIKGVEIQEVSKTSNMASDKKMEHNNGSQKKYDFDAFVNNSIQSFDLMPFSGDKINHYNCKDIKKYNNTICITAPLNLNSSKEAFNSANDQHFLDKYTSIKNPGNYNDSKKKKVPTATLR